MLARLRSRLSYANVVATLALFLALCGGSYAALKLPKNSVGSKQLRKNSVTSTKVKAGSLLTSDFKGSQRKGLVGPTGPRGAIGPAGPVTGTLPSRATLRGVYEFDFVAATAGETEGGSFNFPLSLASAPKVEVVGVGAPSTANCPGGVAKPEAKPGFLCVYKDSEDNADGGIAICDADCVPDPSALQVGAVVYLVSINSGRTYSDGTWAVTAP